MMDPAAFASLVTGVDHAVIAAFLLDPATTEALNPFPATTAGAALHTWSGHAAEFPLLQIQAAGLDELRTALAAMPSTAPLARHNFRSSRYACMLFLMAESGAFVGAVLHGKPNVPLPTTPAVVPETLLTDAQPKQARQLDLFTELA